MPYFVTVIRDSKYGCLAGPFDTIPQAVQYVEPARAEAYKVDPATHFDSFGVSSIPGRGIPGVLNERLGLPGPVSFGICLEGEPTHMHDTAGSVLPPIELRASDPVGFRLGLLDEVAPWEDATWD